MYNFMTVGAVQEPNQEQLDYYFPNLALFSTDAVLEAGYAKIYAMAITPETTLEDLIRIVDIHWNEDVGLTFESVNEMRAALPHLDRLNGSLVLGDYATGASLMKGLLDQMTLSEMANASSKLYYSMIKFLVKNIKHEIVEKSRDYLKLIAMVKHLNKGASQKFPVDESLPKTEHSQYIPFVIDYYIKAAPRLDFKLPKLKEVGWVGVEPPQPRTPDPKEKDEQTTGGLIVKEKLEALQLAISDIEKTVRIKNILSLPQILTESEFHKQADSEIELAPQRIPIFADKLTDLDTKPYDEYEQDVTNKPQKNTKSDGGEAYLHYIKNFKKSRFDKASIQKLERKTLTTIARTLGLEKVPEEFNYTAVLQELRRESDLLKGELPQSRATTEVIIFGGHVVEINPEVFAEITCVEPELECHCDLLKALDTKHNGKPQLSILGVGDHYRIDSTFVEYVRGEMVHTEPVLQGTEKTTSFRKLDRLDEYEETFESIEKEEEKVEEQESSTEDRFKMETEMEQESAKEREQELGVSFSAAYGPVSLSANYGQSSSTSSSDKIRTAREEAQNKMSRALSRIKTKTKTKKEKTTSMRKTSESERNSGFTLDNKSNPSFTGFYHSIDKKYSNQLVCVGKRLMIRLCFQQPMAFLLHCMTSSKSEGVRLEKPLSPEEKQNPALNGTKLKSFRDITVENFSDWGNFFNVTDLPQPPAAISTVSEHKHGNIESDEMWTTGGGKIAVPEGCQAVSAIANIQMSSGSGRYIALAIGDDRQSMSSTGILNYDITAITSEVPYGWRGHTGNSWTIEIVVRCEPTQGKLDQWRMAVYNTIWADYKRKYADYENAILAAKISAGVEIKGRNPLINERFVREELMKLILGATFPQFYYRGLDSLKFGKNCNTPGDAMPIPEPDFSDAHKECPWITFMCQLYEWENMVYDFKPYFFGHKKNWCTLRKLNDVDPKFEAAITAGAVTVDIPVTEGFEPAFFHYLSTGEIWSGNGMPVVGDLLYQAIALELKDAQTSDGTPSGEPWETIEPTSMVFVDDNLPNGL